MTKNFRVKIVDKTRYTVYVNDVDVDEVPGDLDDYIMGAAYAVIDDGNWSEKDVSFYDSEIEEAHDGKHR